MSRFGRVRRVRRRPDHWDSPHERARLRIAERMAGDLRNEEAAWLDEHLADCASCTSLATQYAADRDALRALRNVAPEPPRDLWARTASAIERESGRHGPREAARRPSRIPIGALSGIAVIAVVIGVSTLSGGFFTQDQAGFSEKPSDMTSTTGGDGGSEATAQATPFSVVAGEVRWVDTSANGSLAYNRAPVDEVCPTTDTSGCPTLRDASQQDLPIVHKPRAIIESPTDGQAVAVADDGAGGGQQLIIFDLPEASPAPPPTQIETPAPTPSRSPAPTASAVASPSASASAEPPSATPTPPDATSSPTPSPTAIDTTASPSVSPASPSPSPVLSPTPSIAISIAIASEIELVGESAAFSADGSWFAFTARPDDRSRGPDVYVWQVGDASARPITTDGSTVFASWDGNQVVASRPLLVRSKSTESEAVPVTVRIDPATGAESAAGDVWRPVVDPTRSRAIGWTGLLKTADDGSTWTPGAGTLELRDWKVGGAQRHGNGQSGAGLVVADAAEAGFDVRWDEAGDWVAIWVADSGDPSVGRLSLYRVDTARGKLELPKDAPADVPALPGFSIGEGRLAWATPPGQDGEGSRVQIVAWNEDGVGSIESAPGEDVVIIR